MKTISRKRKTAKRENRSRIEFDLKELEWMYERASKGKDNNIDGLIAKYKLYHAIARINPDSPSIAWP